MLIVFDYCLYESESGRQTEELLVSSYTSVYICLYLNFAFSKTKMFKLLFILLVIKQLLGNLTLDVNIYSAKVSIIWLGEAKWW